MPKHRSAEGTLPSAGTPDAGYSYRTKNSVQKPSGCTEFFTAGRFSAGLIRLYIRQNTASFCVFPQALWQDLEDVNLQYEFSYTALQTGKMTLQGSMSLAFYGMLLQDHPDAITEAEYQDQIAAAYHSLPAETGALAPVSPVTIKDSFGQPFCSASFSGEELNALFPSRYLVETEHDTLYSFFTPDHAHVVTKEKELVAQRPHGTIIITPPDKTEAGRPQISSTQYMYGIFNSHVVTGNTDLHKLLSTPRSFLNLMKNSGQRLYVRLDGVYRLLCLPGLFEMGMNYSRWFYKTADDVITITSYAAVHSPDLILEVHSQNGIVYDFILTNQLVMGTHEYAQDVACQQIDGGLRFTLDSRVYPGLHYDMLCPGQQFEVSDDRIFFTDGQAFASPGLPRPGRHSRTFTISGHI